MIKIYFDGTQIDGDNFSNITKSSNIHNGVFKLGATICETYKIDVNKDIENIPSIVTIYDNTTLKKTLYVTECKDKDDAMYELSLEDSMTRFNFRYDASKIFVGGSTTLKAIFDDICEIANIDTDITTFYGSTKNISWYDNTYMARDYLGYIAELNGKNFRISPNNKLEFVDVNTDPTETIDFEDIENFKIGSEHTISKVIYDNGISDPIEYGDDTGETYYINADNVYVNSSADVQNIYNEINGFTYYNFETSNYPIGDLRTGDLVEFTYNDNSYITFVQFDNASYSKDTWKGSLKIQLENEVQQKTEVVGEEERYRRIKRIVDYDSGRIDQLVEETPTISVEGSGIGGVSLQNLLNTRLIELKIHPTDRDILGLFASPFLKASTTLKALSRGVTFSGNEDYYYPIPDNLYFVDNTYDEFIYSGKDKKVTIIHRIGIENNTKYILDTPIIQEYDYSKDIVIGSGDYSIFMSTYPTAYIYVRAMIQNDYTQNFATSYEVDSKISQTANQIQLEVNEKVDENEIIAKLNLAVENGQGIVELTGNSVIIESDNFKLDEEGNAELSGKITSAEGNVGGFTIGDTSLSANIQDKYTYTLADAQRATSIANGQITPTQEDYEKLDVNKDGIIDKIDAAEILRKYYGYDSTQGTFSINNDDANKIIVFTGNGSQNVNTSIGINRVTTNNITAKYINTVGGNTQINDDGITTPEVTQTSLESAKKDFELLKSGLEIIKKIDIYKYHLKSQKEEEKKHIGFIIGDNYKYSKEITSNENDGVDIYSFVSICCKAIQEQQEIIDDLKSRIEKLEKESDK